MNLPRHSRPHFLPNSAQPHRRTSATKRGQPRVTAAMSNDDVDVNPDNFVEAAHDPNAHLKVVQKGGARSALLRGKKGKKGGARPKSKAKAEPAREPSPQPNARTSPAPAAAAATPPTAPAPAARHVADADVADEVLHEAPDDDGALTGASDSEGGVGVASDSSDDDNAVSLRDSAPGKAKIKGGGKKGRPASSRAAMLGKKKGGGKKKGVLRKGGSARITTRVITAAMVGSMKTGGGGGGGSAVGARRQGGRGGGDCGGEGGPGKRRSLEDGDVISLVEARKNLRWAAEPETSGAGRSAAIKLKPHEEGVAFEPHMQFRVVRVPYEGEEAPNSVFALQSVYNLNFVAPNFRGRLNCAAKASGERPPEATWMVAEHAMVDGKKSDAVRLRQVVGGKWLAFKKSALHRDPRVALVKGARDSETAGTAWTVVHVARVSQSVLTASAVAAATVRPAAEDEEEGEEEEDAETRWRRALFGGLYTYTGEESLKEEAEARFVRELLGWVGNGRAKSTGPARIVSSRHALATARPGLAHAAAGATSGARAALLKKKRGRPRSKK